MQITDTCCLQNCLEPAWTDSDFCHAHHPEKEEYINTVRKTILKRKTLSGCNFKNMDLSGLDLTNKDFWHCSFSQCRFDRSDFSESQFYMCMLDEIQAMNCQFTSIKMLSTVAAGSNFSYSDFTGSDLININFNGILGDSSIFNESDLYCSRFIGASLKNTQFCGCNLVRVDFIDSNLENAVLTDSNPEDAFIMPGDVD